MEEYNSSESATVFLGLVETVCQLTFDQMHTKALWTAFLGNEIKNKYSK